MNAGDSAWHPDRPGRLALFIRSLRGGGGAERNWLQLAGGLAERGHRVDLVLGRREGPFLGEIPPSVRCVDLGGPRFAATLAAAGRDLAALAPLLPAVLNPQPPWVLGCAPALAAYLREARPDALLSALGYSNLTAVWARQLAGVPTRLLLSERNTLSVRAARERRRRHRVFPALARRFYPLADVLTGVSMGVSQDLAAVLGIPASRVITTYSAIATPDIARRAAAPTPHPWLAPGGPPVLLAVGKLKAQKDFPTLLRAFARLRRVRTVRLLVLGQGPDAAALAALCRRLGIAGDVAFPGWCDNPFACMGRAAAFVLSSAWEGLPSVLVQALACGCPVVSTDCPSGPREILEGGRWGALVPVGDAAALAQALLRVLDQPPPSAPLRARAADFSVGAAVDRTLAALAPPSVSRKSESCRATASRV